MYNVVALAFIISENWAFIQTESQNSHPACYENTSKLYLKQFLKCSDKHVLVLYVEYVIKI